MFWYLVPVIALPVLSWFVLTPSVNTQIIPWFMMFAGIFAYATYMEYRSVPEETPPEKQKQKRQEPAVADVKDTISRWYFVLIVMIFAIVWP